MSSYTVQQHNIQAPKLDYQRLKAMQGQAEQVFSSFELLL